MVDLILFSIFLNIAVCSFLVIFLIAKRIKYHSFTLFNANLVLWSTLYALSITAQDLESAILYNRLCSSSIIIMSFLALMVCRDLANKKTNSRMFYINGFCAIILIILMNTPLMINDVRPFMEFKFVPKANEFYYLFMLYYIVNVTYGHIILYKNSRNNTRNRFVFYVFLIGFLGGTTTLFPYFGIPVYPLGSFLVVFYAISITYAIVKHRLFDASMVLSLGFAKILAIASLILSYFYLYNLYLLIIHTENSWSRSAFHIIYLLASCETYQFLVEKFYDAQHKFLKKSYKRNEVTAKLNLALSQAIIMDDFIKALFSIFDDGKKINFIYLKKNWLLNQENKDIFTNITAKEIEPKIFQKLEKIINNINYATTNEEAKEDLKEILDQLNSSCVIPFVLGNETMGFMIIENQEFNYEDLVMFDTLSIQAGLALERIKINNKFIEAQNEKIVSEERSKILKALAGSIAHEMRNPLGAISMTILNNSSILRDAANNINEKHEAIINEENIKLIIENCETSLNSIKRANQVIDMTLSELRNEKPNIENFNYYDIAKSIKQAIEEYSYRDEIEKSKIINKINIENSFIFKGDETLFIYIIFNLLKNALYYLHSKPDSRITIDIEKNDNFNAIGICDTGPGIKPEILSSIFDDFTTSGKKGGTGLGLSFCKRTMQAFDGDIKCESELGKYTKFILYFPKILESEIKNKEEISKNFSEKELENILQNKNIILVDDEEINIKLVGKSLKKYGANIIESKNGIDAFKIITNNYEKLDLIITDIMMPIMNGIELIKNVRNFEFESNKLRKIAIIALTGDKNEDLAKEVFDSGASGYLTKGNGNLELLKLIKNYL
jgi:signal transduction histidine kinase/CheY-like chemotaxis protein